MRTALFLSLATVLAACSESQESVVAPVPGGGIVGAGPALEATVQFGLAPGDVGTDFFPGSHDRSFHAYDNVRPQTVVIAAGGSVTFEISPAIHQVGIYGPGIRPEDIDVTEVEPVPVLPFLTRITDDDGLVVRGPDQQFAGFEWTTPPGTFDEPGIYIVICTTVVHFVGSNMYGWVIVQ
jgi:plastocyanin